MAKEHKADIIAVDDNAGNLAFLTEMLRESGYLVRPARSGKLALAAARVAPPDLFLLDVNMPEMDGYELCRRLREDLQHDQTPIIFISASDEVFDKVMAFSVGGVDYVTKPFQYEVVVARIETHLRLNRQRQEIERLRQQERQYFESLSEMKDQVVQMASHDYLMIDQIQCSRVVENLLSNAIKYSPARGRVAVAVRRVRDELNIAVKDTGVGIPSHAIPHIFERFYRVDEDEHAAQVGTDLGLAIVKTIVKTIVEQHGGRITVSSKVNHGTEFSVFVPAVEPENGQYVGAN